MNIKFVGVAVVIAIATGCASVPMESPEADRTAKEFRTPEGEKAGLYIYRAAGIGTALKKDIWVDGECIGESAPQIFFYTEVDGDQTHTVSTESSSRE